MRITTDNAAVMSIMGWSSTSMAARYQHVTDPIRARSRTVSTDCCSVARPRWTEVVQQTAKWSPGGHTLTRVLRCAPARAGCMASIT